jgi:hypothetical protein
LILMRGDVMEKATWDAISTWVRAGGLLIRAHGKEVLHSVEGEQLKDPEQADHGGAVMTIDADGKSKEFRQAAADALAKASQLSSASRAMVAADGKEDGRFVTLIEPAELLWLDTSTAQISSARSN